MTLGDPGKLAFVKTTHPISLCQTVLKHMSTEYVYVSPCSIMGGLLPHPTLAWRALGAPATPRHSIQTDAVLAWLLRAHAGSYIARPQATYFEQLPEFTQVSDRYACAVFVCDFQNCHVCSLVEHTAPTAIVCACGVRPTEVWSRYARWGKV